jgi:hypothetical protein
MVGLEGLGKLEKKNDLTGIQARDIPARSIAPEQTTLPRATLIIIIIIIVLLNIKVMISRCEN